jgi:hypothetical protein
MKELKDAELTGENVKGTNLSQEELGKMTHCVTMERHR